MEEKIIIWLQSFSNEFLDVFFQGVSYLVSWIGAVLIFAVIFLFVDKKYGAVFLSGFLLTIGANYILKIIVARSRPYVANSQIINKLTTIGMSFPSGHSVSVMFIVLSVLYLLHILHKNNKLKIYKKTWFKVVCYVAGVILVLLTAVARMYLGQHYLSDIIAGLLVGALGFVLSCCVLKKIASKDKKC